VTSVDRLDQLTSRLETVFRQSGVPREEEFDPKLVAAMRDELAAGPRLVDREAFRAFAARIKDKTGFKGKALFHPIRILITGANEGPELDVLVPAIDRAADLPGNSGLKPVVGCRERIDFIAKFLLA
jgi:hypothetical protein